MAKTVSTVGGARIGWVNATWPLATLWADAETLSLNVGLIGTYSFRRDQVASLDPYTLIPLLGWGIRIRHTVAEYPTYIVFWCFGRPRSLINRIHTVGFVPEAQPDEVPAKRGVPVRWQTILAGIVLWNLLFLFDQVRSENGEPGLFSFLALLLLFLVTTNIWWSRSLQRLVLKPGRTLSEVKHWLGLLSLVSGLLCVFFGVGLFGHPD